MAKRASKLNPGLMRAIAAKEGTQTRKADVAPIAPPREKVDLECDAISSHARLQVLAALMQNSANGDFAFEADHLITLGDMVSEEAARAKAAFDDILEIVNATLRTEAANG